MKHLTSTFLFHAAHAFYSNVDAPEPRNLTKEMQQTLSGFQKTAPGFFALEKQFRPQYQQLGAQGNTFMRGADIADVFRFGPASTAGFLRANPFLAGSLGKLYGRMTDSPILSLLNKQAQSGLETGGALTPAQKRLITEQTRNLFSSRGNVMGNQAIGAELLGRDAAMRQKQAAAQQFGIGVQGLNQNQNDLIGRASQIFASALSDPFQAILGRSSGAGSSGQQIGTGAQLFDPLNPYAQDIYNTNYNAKASANIANAQSNNSTTNALIGLAGSLLLSDKRLKRKIKRVGTTKSGIPVKEFEYKPGSSGVTQASGLTRKAVHRPASPRFVGVLAQDVEKVKPSAVFTLPGDIKAVNPHAIDAPFYQVKKGKQPSLGQLLAA